jgi:hypothetical protein
MYSHGDECGEISTSIAVAKYQVFRNATRATPTAWRDPLLADPRGLYDFLSSNLLQK